LFVAAADRLAVWDIRRWACVSFSFCYIVSIVVSCSAGLVVAIRYARAAMQGREQEQMKWRADGIWRALVCRRKRWKLKPREVRGGGDRAMVMANRIGREASHCHHPLSTATGDWLLCFL
jgi:hypothetical protein